MVGDHNFGLEIWVGGVGDRKPGPDPQVPTAPVDPQVQTPLVDLPTITEDVGRGEGDVRSTHGLVSCSPQPLKALRFANTNHEQSETDN